MHELKLFLLVLQVLVMKPVYTWKHFFSVPIKRKMTALWNETTTRQCISQKRKRWMEWEKEGQSDSACFPLSPEDVHVQMAHQKVSSPHPHKPQRGKFFLPIPLQDASYQLGQSELDCSYQLTKDLLDEWPFS